MARSRYCRICRDFHALDAWPEACVGHFGTVSSRAPYVQSDTVAPFRSQADGKMYDSKSAYRRELKARGLVEIGNDVIQSRPVPMPPVRDTLRQVRQQLGG